MSSWDKKCICSTGPDCDGPRIECPMHGLPPRIEDMAPGTTFGGKFIPGGELRYFERTTGSYPIRSLLSHTGYRAADIDPSTIRDVTPPKDAA